jgi:SagB-type dehydrogenase family enzyme
LKSWHTFGIDGDLRRVAFWSLCDDILVETGLPGAGVVLLTRWGDVAIGDPGPAIIESLRRMTFGPVSLDNVVDGEPDRRRLIELLDGIQDRVVRSIGLEDGTGLLLSVAPVGRHARFVLRPISADRQVRLSRSAILRAEDDGLVLESPLAAHRVVLHHPVCGAVIGALATPTTASAVAAATALPLGFVEDLISYLAGAAMVVVDVAPDRPDAGAAPRFAEDSDPALVPWSYHDLLFHARRRTGPPDGGAPASEHAALEPMLKPPPDGPRLDLYRPGLSAVLAADPPLTAAIEARRSYRRFGAGPVTSEQLGELLYRTARLRAIRPAGDSPPATSDRPYPSTNGLHELEVYVVAGACAGVPRAIHHYDPHGHRLGVVDAGEEQVAALLDAARIASGMASAAPLLIVITARFRRLLWLSEKDTYASVMRHVGLFQQSLYLVATAMGLATCAASVHDEDRTAREMGLDWLVESPVGQFALGQRPPAEAASSPRPTVFVNDGNWPERCDRVIYGLH